MRLPGPLAPWPVVSAAIAEWVKLGRIRSIEVIEYCELGLFKDPDVPGGYVAMPYWRVSCQLARNGRAERMLSNEIINVHINAQTGEIIDPEGIPSHAYAAPKLMTWDDMK